jgi:hypothetical protein
MLHSHFTEHRFLESTLELLQQFYIQVESISHDFKVFSRFFLITNSSKLCAEGAIGNLMNVLHCPEIEVNPFWTIVQSYMYLILETLGESSVPTAVLKHSGECDSI